MTKLLVAAIAAVSLGTALAPSGLSTRAAVPCPTLKPLAANAIGPSVAAALRKFDPGARPFVTGARIASSDPARGTQARLECGARVWRRTVVVYVTERSLLPNASLADRVFFVGRGANGGYRVWQTVR